MAYMIFEDLANATPVKIHVETCRYVNRRGDTTTTKWHGPYDYNEAEKIAENLSRKYSKGWRAAKCCLLRQRIE